MPILENDAVGRVTLLKQLALRVPRSTTLTIYTAFIKSILEHGSALFDNCTSTMSDMIENVESQATLTITGAYTNTKHIHIHLKLLAS